ncbi:unnamed protein product [Spirodela intermedia]|uniref:Retroviral polymerase SH3-like domain-containing protein n=1 Tax=Spirodela intermedia TaxID=51605 RepID=A0A7I8LI49_SPIIN|nr:unnamed protein product [Spirodela intermedia]
MLLFVGLRQDFWAELVSTACHLVNISPASVINFKAFEEVQSSNPLDYSDLKIFDCPVYVHVNDDKLEPRAKKCIFLSYAPESNDTSYNFLILNLLSF